ncbi:hypothetical protein PCLA_09f0114 [Pseudomonas citronellolis]|nr:hypothetical protein PCLA_09f0114 [Pseudomonas citronellolis]
MQDLLCRLDKQWIQRDFNDPITSPDKAGDTPSLRTCEVGILTKRGFIQILVEFTGKRL